MANKNKLVKGSIYVNGSGGELTLRYRSYNGDRPIGAPQWWIVQDQTGQTEYWHEDELVCYMIDRGYNL